MKLRYEEFITKIKDQYLDENITIELYSKFREIPGWDTMTGMTLLLMIEEDYNVKIDLIQFKKLITIEELYLFIENQKIVNEEKSDN